MTIRNTRSGKLAFLLIALVILAVLQPVPAKTQDLEQLRKDAEQGNPIAQSEPPPLACSLTPIHAPTPCRCAQRLVGVLNAFRHQVPLHTRG